MKRLKLLFAPLLVAPFLASCSGGDKPGPQPTVYHTLKFNGTHCEMHDAEGNPVQQKRFEAGQTASFTLVGSPTEDFDIPKEENVKLTITGTDNPFDGTYSYNPIDGSLSVKMTSDITVTAVSEEKPQPVNPYEVTEDEFNNACSLSGDQYVQVYITDPAAVEYSTSTYTIEISPTVSHRIDEVKGMTMSYHEIFTRNNGDGTYRKATREDDSKDEYKFEDADESDFITTKSSEVNVLEQLKHLELSYKSFAYSEKGKTYSATCTPQGGTETTITLKFENKKLIREEIKDTNTRTVKFEYETKTPSFPKEK